MADDVKLEVIKKTQDSLGKYFKKPPLTEKLLKKPPFRFLHDIISAVIKETGFLDGLFTEEELNSENIKTKEAKLAYLTKLIDVVKLSTGVNLSVRASKIVSGQEATKTNELLQTIGKALDKKISSTEAIEKYKKNVEKGRLTSRSRSTGKDEKKPSSKDAPQKRATVSKEKPTEQKRKVSTVNNVPANGTEIQKDEIQEPRRNSEVVQQPQERVPSSGHRRRSSATRSRHNPPSTPSEMAPLQMNAQERQADDNKKHKDSENKAKQTTQIESNESQNHILAAPPTTRPESTTVNNIENNVQNESMEEIENKENEVLSNDSFNQNMEKSENLTSDVRKSQLENIGTSVSEVNSRPRTSLRPPSARPISARPAAPRIRGKAELLINEEISTPVGTISVIVENSETKDNDDAEDMIVMETRGGGDSLDNNDIYKVNDQLTQEHGHLVAQILETQKELVNNENVDVIPKKTNISWDTSAKRDMVAKEVDKLRNTIQTLTRATNPLGKLLDYFQEDVEIMQKELLDWRNQYQQVNEELKMEKMKTQELIEPMKETLKEIDNNVKMQLDKICQVKSQIMKNDHRIQTLLNGHT